MVKTVKKYGKFANNLAQSVDGFLDVHNKKLKKYRKCK
jgi:hypothetical protein